MHGELIPFSTLGDFDQMEASVLMSMGYASLGDWAR
uniref:Uncharacterized protein n=1 Tax=Arundo donax TaxID=35708 RepID=A0A0A9EJ75_ARUDO